MLLLFVVVRKGDSQVFQTHWPQTETFSEDEKSRTGGYLLTRCPCLKSVTSQRGWKRVNQTSKVKSVCLKAWHRAHGSHMTKANYGYPLRWPPGDSGSHLTDEQRQDREGQVAGLSHKGGRSRMHARAGWCPTCEAVPHVLGQQHAIRAGTGELGRVGIDLRGRETQVLAATIAEGGPLTPVHP